MNKARTIGFIVVMLGMLILHYLDIFPLLIFIPIFVFNICVELVRVFRGELKLLVPILYDLGAICCIATASYFFTDNIESFSKNVVGISLFCLLGAIFIYSGTSIRNHMTRVKNE